MAQISIISSYDSGTSSSQSRSYEYKKKSTVRRKLKILTNLEFPLIQKSGLFENEFTLFGKGLIVFGKIESAAVSSNPEIQYQNMVGRKGQIWNFRRVVIRNSSFSWRELRS
jgi:hypothetical protein